MRPQNSIIMKSLFKIVFVFGLSIGLFSCQPDDNSSVTPPRPYDEVYNEDILKIEEFLGTHYVTIDGDFNTIFTKIPEGGSQVPVSDMPELQFEEVDLHDIKYKVYYLKLREGAGQNPTRVDSTLVAYKGNTMYKGTVDGNTVFTQNVFEENITPVWFNLDGVIRGWSEIIPKFKTGTFSANLDGTISYQNFGVGVIFIPSGLAYFSSNRTGIPAYSNLIFNFKLYNMRAMDHDRDGILSMYEYGNPLDIDRFKKDPIDTDGDTRPDYLDVDDDGDGYLTKNEIKKPVPLLPGQGTKLYYPFNPILDDPLTPSIDESEPKGIPDASGDGTSSTRIRRHLDKNAKPPFSTY